MPNQITQDTRHAKTGIENHTPDSPFWIEL
ncbi:hypothetical protein SAMN05216201_105197 [Pseudomonas linyingensis]|uniref:Uncharacterized protein n=1 Tax=Pseudomonas linyingensis TaxID=915471 RepID=A0A1H6WWI6_9PSED|nr:hypothetical protein SAMN05216201_105197 [Pseudomonas linyingensis]